VPQPADGVTYAAKIDKAETRIDWSRPAATLDRLVRAMSPAPGAWCEVEGNRVRVLRAVPEPDGAAPPGTLLDGRLLVACGEGALRLVRVQREGRQPMDADAFLRGFRLGAGDRLG
jgi:methionyl-tRNA formyltransferase